MSSQLPERASARQLRVQAKELLRKLRSHDADATEMVLNVDGSPLLLEPKLSDAQRVLARSYGFPSWRALIEHVETPEVKNNFRAAVNAGDAASMERLLAKHAVLRRDINEPLFDFDAPAMIAASKRPNFAHTLPVLVRFGADPNARSKWWAGGFSALDMADSEAVELLLQYGATFDVWSASAARESEVLTRLLHDDPASVNAPGGDGMRPLHFASTPEVANLLLNSGADLEIKDVDHESTPAEYQIDRPDILRMLIDRGATADAFMATALDDLPLLMDVLQADPSATQVRVGEGRFSNDKGNHIYAYKLGVARTPLLLAAERKAISVLPELLKLADPAQRLVAAAMLEDDSTVDALLREDPAVGSRVSKADARVLPDAAGAGRLETVRLLLKAGIDKTAPGMDAGSALHVAAWFGQREMVELLADQLPINEPCPHHGSPPLGWALHGSQMCRNPKGDYPGVIRALIRAGADPTMPSNRNGLSMLGMAGDREDVKSVLREFI